MDTILLAAPAAHPTTLATPTMAAGPEPIALADGAYAPGACNIGPWEIRRRRRSAIVGYAIAAAILAALIVMGVPVMVRALVLFPIWGATVSWLQARRQFCVGFAVARLSNFTDGEAGRLQVTDEAAHRADMRMVRRMVFDAFVIAVAATVVVVGASAVLFPA
ncbi:MAG TPA: hypothetical protein VGM28_09120 [Candidatus Limnocylindrales bacterium]|jgi:hypothetical protein